MHAFHLAFDGGFEVPAEAHLTPSIRPTQVEVSMFFDGLLHFCRQHCDADMCHDVLDDTHLLFKDAGYTSWNRIERSDLAALVFSTTRDWEYVGDGGTIDIVRLQRDYSRALLGEELFWQHYQGMQTVDGHSFYCALV